EWGHVEGDATIARVAGWLEQAAEKRGTAAFRIGGDEFLFLLPGISPQDAAGIAGEIVSECEILRIPYPPRPDDMKRFFDNSYDSRDFLALNAVALTISSAEFDVRSVL